MQYFFVGGKKVPVQTLCHGNSRIKERPFYRTQLSTLETIKEESKTKTASVTYCEAAGGIDSCWSVSEEPRNKMQVYNARYNARKSIKGCSLYTKVDIFDLLSLLKDHQSMAGGGFNYFYPLCRIISAPPRSSAHLVTMHCCYIVEIDCEDVA